MKVAVRLQREPSEAGATLGALYVNDAFVCWTLEDVVREPPGGPIVLTPAAWVNTWKIPGVTAIPSGRFRLVFEPSPKFGRNLWELKGVPGFDETKFHAGNRPKDSIGCPLVGLDRKTAWVGRSADALELFHRAMLIAKPGDDVFVDVLNPPGLHFEQPPTWASLNA